MAPRIRYPVPNLDEWAGPRYQIRMHRTDNDFCWEGSRAARDFEVRYIHFEPNAHDDGAWHFQHMLGRGGFGLVGLWSKRNEDGEVVDNLAVKEMPMPQNHNYRLRPGGRPIPEEAIIQRDLQKKNCIPVLQMRGLSILTAPAYYREKLRYYLEYCPYGDLDHVLRAYASILDENPNSVERVPEPFLWQMLYNFTQVMLAMEQPPFSHPNANNIGSNPFVLHLDIKQDNIMLAEPEDEDLIVGYPACKVGDWGLAVLTSLDDERNSVNYKRTGTRGWFPPEQYNGNRFGGDWTNPPPWRDGTNAHAYSTAHSVFAFASIIFRLMVVDLHRSHLDAILDVAARSEDYVYSRKFKFVQSSDMDHNTFGQPTRYSPLLKDTIANCLHLDPASRPSAVCLERLAHDMCVQNKALQFQDGHNTFPHLEIEEVDPNTGGITW